MKILDIQIVSNGEYAARKTLAISLRGGFWLCSVGIVLCLIGLAFAYYLDVQGEAQARITQGWAPDQDSIHGEPDLFISYFSLAAMFCFIAIPSLLIIGIFLWVGSERSWHTVHKLQPIDYANKADLPASDSLVRASEQPTPELSSVLLRATIQDQETHPEQLVRPVES